MTLYHYTCEHSRRQIGDSGELLPVARLTGHPSSSPQSWLVWLTDLDFPDRDGLGLTSELLDCDRTEHRYRVVDESGCVRWGDLPRPIRRTLAPLVTPGRLPMHWWVSDAAVPVVYDPLPARHPVAVPS